MGGSLDTYLSADSLLFLLLEGSSGVGQVQAKALGHTGVLRTLNT